MEHEMTVKGSTVFIPTHILDFTFYVRHCTVTYRAPEIPYGDVYELFFFIFYFKKHVFVKINTKINVFISQEFLYLVYM